MKLVLQQRDISIKFDTQFKFIPDIWMRLKFE